MGILNKLNFVVIVVVLVTVAIFTSANSAFAEVVHRVEDGESLYLVAKKYRVQVNDLIQKNNLRNPKSIYPRQVLIIPGVNKGQIHRVNTGESLFMISEQYQISLQELARENHLSNMNQIVPGQILFIPKPKPKPKPMPEKSKTTYTVQQGDSLYLIAKKLQVSMVVLEQLNQLSNGGQIYPGQVLQLPTAENTQKPTPPLPKPKPKPAKPYIIPDLLREYPDNFFLKGDARSNKIALTFDDGPDRYFTNQILDVLKQQNVPGTFFLMGNRVTQYPDVVQRIAREGHVIGSHSWSHPNLTKLTKDQVDTQIRDTERAIKDATGINASLLRPPYGEVSRRLLDQMQDMNYRVVNWSADSRDWLQRDVDQILINTLPDVRGGAILLFHSAGGEGQSLQATVDVLAELIYTLKVQGYELVTVNELLDIPAYQ